MLLRIHKLLQKKKKNNLIKVIQNDYQRDDLKDSVSRWSILDTKIQNIIVCSFSMKKKIV